ncbi:putative nudix hydrolase 8-like [Capsicum annuum]|nr:putative nudix hydrolase 8-like [Capsicum annuum]
MAAPPNLGEGGIIVEVGKFASKCIYPKIENIVRFSSNIDNLRDEMKELTKLRDDIKGKVEGAEGEGYKPKPDVIKWIEGVHELEKEWETTQERIAAAKALAYKSCPKCSLRSEVSTQAKNIRDQQCRLIKVGENFASNLVIENYQVKKVELITGTAIEGQHTAIRNLHKILQLLEDDKVCIIGVWGNGGVGKTTLVKNLNNELLKNLPSSKLSFGVVIWVTVPKPPIDIRKIQAQIAGRLSLTVDDEAGEESIASKIYERLEKETSFLLILDDVWEAINLDDVGVPQPEYTARSKEQFHPLAKKIARECDGLPLAITVIGSSMRGKTRVELWKDALDSLRRSEPYYKNVKDKVYSVIKWSYDTLESRDIQSCFLYCSLYPAAIPIDDIIHCWWAEGILGEHDMYEQAYNRGITLIESLKDACLLEANKMHYVKMHDVVRDVAIWISSTFGDEHTSVFQARIRLTELNELPPVANLHNLQVLDCDDTVLRCLPQGMDNLTNLRLLNMSPSYLGATSFDEISSLRNLTHFFIRVDSSSCLNRDYTWTWMTRLKGFHIRVGETSIHLPYNKSVRAINVHNCEIFSNGELSSMSQFASDLYLNKCMGLRKLIAYNTFNGLKFLNIQLCSCSLGPVEGGSGKLDPLPNLEHLDLHFIQNLKSVSDFGQYLGLRFSKLRQLDISECASLTCLFNDSGVCSVPKHLEEIVIDQCYQLVELYVQCSSSDQAELVNSEIPRVRKLKLYYLPELGTLGEPQSTLEHLEELTVIGCDGLRKLPLSIQTSKNIKIIKGKPEWWSQLEWDDDNFKSNLEHCFHCMTGDVPINFHVFNCRWYYNVLLIKGLFHL